jgi:hypothetical protein
MALSQKLPQMVLPYRPYLLPHLDLPLKEKDPRHQIQVEALDQILQFLVVILLLAVLLVLLLLLVVLLRLLVLLLECLLLKVYILNMRSY